MSKTFQSDHEDAREWARSLLKEAEADPHAWIILDTETTGIPPDPIEIVQIGLLWPDGTPAMDTLVKPEWAFTDMTGIPPAATAIHGITDAMVEDAPTFTNILPRLGELIHGRKVIVYNVAYDFEVLLDCFFRRNYAKPGTIAEIGQTDDAKEARSTAYAWLNAASEWECAMHWYSQWVGDWNSYRRSYKWQRLPGATHGAIGDCQACLEVIKRMAGKDQ